MAYDESGSSFNQARQNQRQRINSSLSAEAPAFVPLAQRVLLSFAETAEGREKQYKEFMERVQADEASAGRRGPNGLPIYENQLDHISSHWIPIYGAGHGMFFDAATNDFRGDGLPRPTFERPVGTIPGRHQRRPRLIRPWEHPEDPLHIQPTVFVSQSRPVSPDYGTQHRYLCSCTGSWLPEEHDCPQEQVDHEAQYMDAVPALQSVQDLREDWVEREILIGNTGYLRTEAEAATTNSAAGGQEVRLTPMENQDISAAVDTVERLMFGASLDDEAQDSAYEDEEQQAAGVLKDEGLEDESVSTRSKERKRARAKKRAEREEAAEGKEKMHKDDPGDDGSAPGSHIVDLSGMA
ncbi:MAG: hypothetical protein Q9167_002297 [Letrouitia subvulpina]